MKLSFSGLNMKIPMEILKLICLALLKKILFNRKRNWDRRIYIFLLWKRTITGSTVGYSQFPDSMLPYISRENMVRGVTDGLESARNAKF